MRLDELKFFLKHSSVYGLGTIFAQSVGFLLLPLYTKYLTPADYGVMAIVEVVKGVVGLVISMGVVESLSRFYYEYADKYARNVVVSTGYLIVFVCVLFAFPLVLVISSVLSEVIFFSSKYELLFMVALLSLLFNVIADYGLAYLRVRAESIKFVQINIVRTLFLIGFNIYFIVVVKIGVIGIFYSSLIVSMALAVGTAFFILTKTKLLYSFSLIKEMTVYSFPLIFSSIFTVAVNESDKFFINLFFSPVETGIYSIAQKIGTAIHMLLTSPFIQTYIPRRFEIMKRPDAKQEYADILHYYLLAISSIGLVIAVFSREIIILMTSAEFYPAAKYIPPIVLSMIVFGMKYHFETGIVIRKKTKAIAYISGISCVMNIFLNAILISRFGVAGAIISINISYLFTTLSYLIVGHFLYPIRYHYSKLISLFLLGGGIFSLTVVFSVHSFLLTIFIKMSLLILYLILLYKTSLMPSFLRSKVNQYVSLAFS